MQARALLCDEQQSFSLEDVILPDPGPQHVLVKTHCSGVSIGTEFALIQNKISWGPYPLCTGYQGVGVVEQVGEQVEGFRVGDAVYFRDSKVMELTDGTKVSAVTGTHSSHALVDPKNTHGIALLPAGVTEEVASLYVMPAVGLYGVDMANPRMGETVAVFGVGMIGLGVVAACVTRGCVVVAIDLEENRLEVARKLGADHTISGGTQNVEAELRKLAPQGADVVFESTGIPACLDPAIALCKPLGKFVWQGNYGADPVSLHFLTPHGKRLQMFFPCDDGMAPCRRAVMRNMALGALKWEHCITHRVTPEESPALFDRINKGQAKDVIGAVIQWA
ncbi:MAG: hypothetical protein COZ06_03950 [Armatimonadetes bacterium CG_4_10_14_3_um_filter_66_18]|nr:zinc-binding alcohol dehydrogenase [Armatimonadota bacterium]PIU92573.1 MAG: hypothetical protein COS65_17160 [Armatimonadetes bacterium CG06_land_8_20_14_3_00_66_21]PIY51814.1 MAG: hypothetical protein COZ06_03950 [Armatimonadetes bacterium CG_4_10_14_3_um_filter_66_18]PJB71469.1 MAG: hypothetical protein CO096_09770 [Armatimonadetes bacterium CG_4_9_14_3_um_filter_66_14]NCO92398.1 zinc-binding alcohol dehydrogenase [Armatimonadota bacterium]